MHVLELDFAPFSLGYTCWSKMEGAAPEVGFCAMPAGMHVLEKKEPAATRAVFYAMLAGMHVLELDSPPCQKIGEKRAHTRLETHNLRLSRYVAHH